MGGWSERVMGQKGFFDVERRLEAFSALGDPLETIKKMVRWEDFARSRRHQRGQSRWVNITVRVHSSSPANRETQHPRNCSLNVAPIPERSQSNPSDKALIVMPPYRLRVSA